MGNLDPIDSRLPIRKQSDPPRTQTSLNRIAYPRSRGHDVPPPQTHPGSVSTLISRPLVPQPNRVHEVAMRNLRSLIDRALITFEPAGISHCTNPTGWIQADVNHINTIIQDIVILTQRNEIRDSNFGGAMIYQHLIVYTFLHLMHCADDQSLLNDFKEKLKTWRDRPSLTIIENQQLIRDHLIDLFWRVLQRQPHSHSESTLTKLLTIDDMTLCAHLSILLTNSERYHQVLSLCGAAAQAMLNLLQARLHSAIDPTHKHCHIMALIKLSRRSGLYPECLVLNEMEIKGDAVAGGAFGDVHKGHFEGRDIAVKILKVYQRTDVDKILKEFSSEAVTWRQLSHPNVLPFYGVFHLDKNPLRLCLVSPWMENGNIVDFLANSSTSHIDCIPLCLDIAGGLDYLHSQNIIHGDLKGLNILVSQSQRACIADFGLATAIHSASTTMTQTANRGIGTLRWQAPELWPDMTSAMTCDDTLAEPHNTKASDVYAFASVCYEIFSGNWPFHDIRNNFTIMFAVQSGRRPPRPSEDLSQIRGLNDEIWYLIETCWNQEASARPTAHQVLEQLQALPDRPADQRPIDNFEISFPSRSRHTQLNRPFSTLVRET